MGGDFQILKSPPRQKSVFIPLWKDSAFSLRGKSYIFLCKKVWNMKIVDKTKMLHALWAWLSLTINVFITCLFLFFNFPKTFVWQYFLIVPIGTLVIALLEVYGESYAHLSRTDIIAEYVGCIFLSILMTIFAFVIIGILCGILLILAMLLEGCVIPIIQNRYRIINKIKAHMKRNNSKKQQ